MRLIESGLGLLKTIRRISIGPGNPGELYRIFGFVQLEWILLIHMNGHKTGGGSLTGVHTPRQQFVPGVNRFYHALGIGAHNVFHDDNVAWLCDAVIWFRRHNQAEGLNIAGCVNIAVRSFAVIV